MPPEGDPHCNDGYRNARQRGPQTDKEKRSCGDSDDSESKATFKNSRESCRRDQAEHLDLPRRQVVLPGVIRQFGDDLWGYTLLTGMDSMDGFREISVHASFQDIAQESRYCRIVDSAFVGFRVTCAGVGSCDLSHPPPRAAISWTHAVICATCELINAC